MSMPTIVHGTGTREQAVNDLLESVALEQTALSHILNAEGEKIQKVVECAGTLQEILDVNKSVESMVNTISVLENILQNKLNIIADKIM